MKYNFDKIPNRRGTNSLKWDVDRKELPMWVADMDFETVPEVQEALVQRVAHGVYGYSVIPDEWADSYVNWWEKRHHFRMDPKKLIFTTGVIPALSSAVRKLTTPAENVLFRHLSIIISSIPFVITEEMSWKMNCFMMEKNTA